MTRVVGLTLALATASSVSLRGQTPSGAPDDMNPAAPLFASNDSISVRLIAPFRTLFRDRSDDAPALPARLTLTDTDGRHVQLPVDVELRGITRRSRSVCSFPPLRLDFPRAAVAGTLFDGQNRLKLVTHCRDRDEYEQYVVMEYLLYRTLNVLTDMSFRVRLTHITYEDAEQADTVTKLGFLIEDDDALAARFGLQVLDIPAVRPADVDPSELAIVELFQYLIGNTDFSAFRHATESDVCCHNAKLIGLPAGPVYSVPYDFDYSGVIDARYAVVSEKLPLENVTQRYYRGRCWDGEIWANTIRRFRDRRNAIYELFRHQPELRPNRRDRALRYFDDFYQTIEDTRASRQRIMNTCAPWGE